LDSRFGDLCVFELDHVREHSVELQVVWLQHLFGKDSFRIVALLCPDPCGPTGTAPCDGRGIDLREFAFALRDVLSDDPQDTLVVAGADFSHVGAAFGDERRLGPEFLTEVRQRDEIALARLADNDAEGFRAAVATDSNPTRVCSAGCIFTLSTALSGRTATVLGYHQAVDHPTQTCVTCAAVAFT
jgi:AmmeMemoRadiSam system protein B